MEKIINTIMIHDICKAGHIKCHEKPEYVVEYKTKFLTGFIMVCQGCYVDWSNEIAGED